MSKECWLMYIEFKGEDILEVETVCCMPDLSNSRCSGARPAVFN